MRISGTESSSVIVRKTLSFQKLKSDAKKGKKAEATRDGVINKKIQFQSISTRKMLMLSNRYDSNEVDRRTWLRVPSGTL